MTQEALALTGPLRAHLTASQEIIVKLSKLYRGEARAKLEQFYREQDKIIELITYREEV